MDDDTKEAWNNVVDRTHSKQAVWWLNGFWNDLEEEAEALWEMVHIMIEIECGKAKRYGKLKWKEKEGCDLDQFQSHRFLEKMGETLTVKELRAKVKNLDVDNNKRLALSEYLADKYSKTIKQIIKAPQGGQAAQEQLDLATKAFEDAVQSLEHATEEKGKADDAAAAAAQATEASEQAKAAVQAAVEEVESQEAARNKKLDKLKKKIANKDKRLSQMKVNTARNELAQFEGEDPLPLRKAKLTQKAALKKSKKALKKAKAEQKKSEAAAEVAAAAAAEAQQLVDEAAEALKELKEKGDGVAHGNIWWMERELEERQKFMPRR